MSSENKALYIPQAKAAYELGPAETYEPDPHDLLIKNTSVSLNPAEYKLQKFAAFPIQYPSISGFSFAGTVEKIGSAVAAFKPGDRVVAQRKISDMSSGNGYGGFQKYALVQDTQASKLDENTSFDGASAVISNLASVVGALNLSMGMDRPPISGRAARKNQKLLVYGGSSIFGLLMVDYAARAGYDLVTTSSPRNVDEVKRFSPDAKIVLHTLPKEEVIEALIAEGPYDFVFDAINLPDTRVIVGPVVKKFGGGAYWSAQPVWGPDADLPEGVERKGASYPPLVESNEEVRKWFFEEYVPKGLSSGAITVPRLEKIGGGLNGIPDALERLGTGKVSGGKLVLNPWET